MNTNEVINICKQLSDEGKKPTVALVKTRMAGPKILPLIIEGIKQYTANPNAKFEEAQYSVEETMSDKERISVLEAQVSDLIKQVKELQASEKSSLKK